MAMIPTARETRTFRHAHLFCGIGAGAQGFNHANPRVGNVTARFECAGGIDVDPGAILNFEKLTGAKGTVLDLFDEDQYLAFHGIAPPAGWRMAGPADVFAAFGPNIDVAFTSAPCKGFSGLMGEAQSKTDKYQALNALTLRGVWLLLEAYKDQPIPIVLFENVPRIANRGRKLLDQIIAIFRNYGYHVAEDVHDCGEIGGLGQSRKRFLLIARHPGLVPPFVYRPIKHRLKGVGEIIGKLPLPGDPRGGPMHRIPKLQWQTWVRLAFVPAGKDWRALNDLEVVDGQLRDFGLVPEFEDGKPLRDGALGVVDWNETGPCVTTARSPGQGRFSVADPRPNEMMKGGLGVVPFDESMGTIGGETMPTNGKYAVADPRPAGTPHNDALGVRGWDDSARVVAGARRPFKGAHSVADPRPPSADWNDDVLGVRQWDETMGVIPGKSLPGNGAFSVADPRGPIVADAEGRKRAHGKYPVDGWDAPSKAVIGGRDNGAFAVADPRTGYKDAHHNVLRVTPFDESSGVVTSASHPAAGALSVADPRIDGHEKSVQLGVRPWGKTAPCVKGDMSVGTGPYAVADPRMQGRPRFNNTFRIVPFDSSSPAVAGPGGPAGGLSVADPRPPERENYSSRKYKVQRYDEATRAVIGASATGDGAFAVADPRCTWGADSHRSKLRVTGYDQAAGTITGTDRIGSGAPSVADPRPAEFPDAPAPFELPPAKKPIICRIVALDGTWHRPFTTLELAALQSLFDPDDVFDLESSSDAVKREWIGNAVPSAAAQGMAETIGETLLLAGMGETFMLSTREIWVKPLALALSVDSHQVAFDMDRRII